MRSRILLSLLALLAAPATHAQSLRDQCQSASREEVRTFCGHVADATDIVPSRIGIALSGGNPVPGTASTLGMRIGSLPRISLALRVSAAEVELPPVERVNNDRAVSFPVGSIGADLSVGLFSGITLLPTVGGFGSIDLLASVGMIPLPRGEGFDDSSPVSWAAGARLGILRESFTAPGLSVSAMYRKLDEVSYGSETLSDRDAFFQLSNYDATSLRVTAGKRLLGFGLTAGAGYDRYSADISALIRDPRVLEPAHVLELSETDKTASRVSVFGNVSFTLLILNLAAEAGWQQGGNVVESVSDRIGRGAVFGGIALRIAI